MTRPLNELSVVVLSHNRVEELRRTFIPLCQVMEKLGFQLIIVDNASDDGSSDLIRRAQASFPALSAIFNERNLGVGGGRNCGWKVATRDFIVNLDDDTRVTEDSLYALLNMTLKYPGAGVVFPRVLHPKTGRDQTEFGSASSAPANFHGACHVVRRKAFINVGPLDDGCSFGGEELDYSIRMRTHGWDVVFDANVVVFHNSSRRTGVQGQWRQSEWTRNLARIHFKHFPARVAGMFTWRMVLSQVLGGSRRQGVTFGLALLRAANRGRREGEMVYAPVPDEIVHFYRDRSLRPDIGNVPIIVKICMKTLMQARSHFRNHRKRDSVSYSDRGGLA